MQRFEWFPFLHSEQYDVYERFSLWVVLAVAVAGLIYAGMLVGQVLGADQGTEKMQAVAEAIRRGPTPTSPASSRRSSSWSSSSRPSSTSPRAARRGSGTSRIGRAAAFFMGATFSWIVGFVGMSLAVRGNLRVAAAARTSYGGALQLGYRTGTITGMLTDGLGLLGGTLIFMAYGEHAYEVLLGFGFGGTLLALFMRVGGGIYTKAADVGADLVGKVEADIPEDDPRNAATIADNVGDNVGDCAGMAADIFESYEVTIVAAMILGYASFGHKGVIFPLLVRAIGVVGSIISTYSVKAGAEQHQRRGAALGPPRVHHRLDHQRRRVLRCSGSATSTSTTTTSASTRRPSAATTLTERVRRRPADRPFETRRTPTARRRDRRRASTTRRTYRDVRHGATTGRSSPASQPFWSNFGWQRPRHAAGLDLPDRDRPGDRPEQVHELLHAHPVRAGEVAGQGVPDRARDEHHPGVRRRLRVDRGGAW